MVSPLVVTPGEALILEAIRSLPIEVGTITSPAVAGGNVLADTTKNWVVNVHRNRIVKITKGVGVGQTAIIRANLGQSLTVYGTWAIAIGVGASYMILDVDVASAVADALSGGSSTSTGSLAPIDKAVQHNAAVVAGVDIFAAALVPTNTPCLFRIAAGFNTSGILSITIIRAGNTQVQQFNGGVALNTNSLYMFAALIHAGDTVNYRYSVNATLQTMKVQEIVAAT